MITQSKGKIFLADERGATENENFRILNTFKFDSYQQVHKEPFGNLYALNENTLGGGISLKWTVECAAIIILIPIVGAIVINNDKNELLDAGMAKLLCLPAGASYEVSNPYKEDLIKYVQLWIKAPANPSIASCLVCFDLNSYQLTTLFNDIHGDNRYKCSIIKLNGRQEDVYYKKNSANGVFVFTIQGALEVQYRLMHEGDGLALWDVDEIEFEALSNEAILLVIEVALS